MRYTYLTRKTNTFEKLADIAAINYYRVKYWWSAQRNKALTDDAVLALVKCPPSAFIRPNTFRKPTSDPRGYFNVLKFITSNADGVKRINICKHFERPSMSFQLDTLEDAKLIRLDRDNTHKFYVTDLGKAYIAAVESEFND